MKEVKSKFWRWYIPVLIILCVIVCVLLVINKNKNVMESDAYKFKTEYTELNNQVNDANNKEYLEVTLSNNNPFVYASEDDIKSLFDGGTGVIYFGFPKCPWCRNLVPVLSEAATSLNYNKVYYYNILNIRSSFTYDADNKLVKTDGTEFYYYLLDKLDSNLTEYVIKDKNNKEYDTKEKRLYAPTIVFINHGVVEAIHESTVDSQTDPYVPLTSDQKEELTNIIQDNIRIIQTTCTENC